MSYPVQFWSYFEFIAFSNLQSFICGVSSNSLGTRWKWFLINVLSKLYHTVLAIYPSMRKCWTNIKLYTLLCTCVFLTYIAVCRTNYIVLINIHIYFNPFWCRYEAIIPGDMEIGCVLYKNKLYCFESEEKLLKFLRSVHQTWPPYM